MNKKLLRTLALAWWGFLLAVLGLKIDLIIGSIIMGCITATLVVLYVLDGYNNRKQLKQSPLHPFTLRQYRVFYSIVTGVQFFEGVVAIYLGAVYFQLITLLQLPIDLTMVNVFFVSLIAVGILFLINVVQRFIQWGRKLPKN